MTTNYNSEMMNQLKVTNTIFFALISGVLFFLVIVVVITQNKQISEVVDIDKIFTFIVPAFGLIVMFITRIIFKQMIAKVSSDKNLIQKIIEYRKAKIVQWSLIESGCIFSLVATLLTSNYFYLAIFFFLFGYFFLVRPSKEYLIKDLRLNSMESDLIINR